MDKLEREYLANSKPVPFGEKPWDAYPPPGHSRCGGNKVAGYDVSQEEWDGIFAQKHKWEHSEVGDWWECERCGKQVDGIYWTSVRTEPCKNMKEDS